MLAVVPDGAGVRHPLVAWARAAGVLCVQAAFLLDALLIRKPPTLLEAAMRFGQ